MTATKKIIRTLLIILGLCMLAAAACAETKTVMPYTYEILDEENKTAQIVDYNPPRTGSSDEGIELTIPAEYFDNTDFIEFNHAEDGSLYITLKHISSIVNRG